MSNNNFIVPQGQMSIPTSIPESSGMDVELVPEGIHPAYLAHIIDYGTQKNNFNGKESKSRQITLVFELPHEKRVYSEEYGEQSSLLWKTTTFVVSEKSNLFKVLKAISGKSNVEPEDFKHANLGEFLGKPLCITVEHQTKSNGKARASITGYTKFNENLVPKEQFVASVPNQFFLINEQADDMNFTTMNFATLYESCRKTIMESDEAIAYAENGGQFAQHIDINKNKASNTPPAAPSAPGTSSIPDNMEWLSKEFTYDDMVANGWTKEDLIAHGYAKEKAPAAPKAPTAPSAPKAPVAPSAPKAPTAPSASNEDDDDEDDDDLPF